MGIFRRLGVYFTACETDVRHKLDSDGAKM